MNGKTNHIMFKLFKLLLVIIFASGVNELRSQTFIIKGNIKNSNGEPVEFASIQLLFESVYHQYALSDSMGNYYLETTKTGDCELLVNILGYSAVSNKFALKNDTIIDFVLQPDPLIISEATIIGQKELIEAKSDRLVVNISGNVETKGKEITDILKQLPTVNITDQSMNIFGKSSVIVYINDRIVRLEGQSLLNYLNSFPPDIISSVEIITSPPAQYDAEGNPGIIKIVTKKNILPGWKEYFRAGYVQATYSSYMVSALVNYTGEKIFFEGNINNWNSLVLNQINFYDYFPDETISTFNPRKWRFNISDAEVKLGYNFNKNSNIIVDFQIPLHNKETMIDIENQTSFVNSANNQTDSIMYSTGTMITNNYTFNSEVFFKHLFPNRESYFTASMAYLNNHTEKRRDFSSLTQINSVNSTTDNYYTKGGQNYNILTPKIDFVFSLFNCTVNAGLKLSFIKTSSDNELFNFVDHINILDPSQSNKYKYTEEVQSVYYSMEKTIPKWSFKAGIRSEMTQTVGNSLITNEQYKNNYTDFFLSIYISHKLNNKSSISLSYASRIERPPYQYLDPFKWYINKYSYGVGNPFLKPSYIKNLELTYVLNHTFSTKIYYTRQDDKTGQYVVLDSLNILEQIQQTDNFFNVNIYGISIYKFLKLFNWLETVLQGNFNYSEYHPNKKEFADMYGISSTVIANNTFRINKKFQIVCNLEERFPGLYNYRSMNNFFKIDIGFNYTNSKKGFEARFLVGDILKTANPEYTYISGGVKQIYRNYNDTRMFRLTLSWRLGNWYNKTPQISLPSNADEKQRL
ncbi:MAG: TonB-dependent receptor [Prevotellaceae bacterium]|jgi:hypothetical protein|nr:TonB-dependent receptor [Prevotellaceae bacterium]